MAPKPLPATDPDVRIPAAVRRGSERASQIHEAAYKPPAPQPGEGGTPPVTPEGNNEVTIVARQPNAPPPAASASEANPPPAPPAPPAPAATAPDDWEHRYSSMKGRFEQADKRNRELAQEISRLHGLLATLSTSPTHTPARPNGSTPPATEATPADVRFRITPEEEQEYGKDFLELVGRKAGQIAEDMTRELRAELENLKGQVSSVGSHMARSAFEQMTDTLDVQVPNWREINDNPEFIRWLRLQDPYSGAIRHALLTAAWERNDTPRVLAFFKGFLNEEAAVDPARGHNPPPAGGTPPAGKPDLTSLAAPGRAKSGASTPPADEKPIITRAQISAFYRAVNNGAYAGKDAEKNRLEAMIFDAQREGRIQ